jgi:uncharacterized protein with von Willebrand factor type A (vWA) domain
MPEQGGAGVPPGSLHALTTFVVQLRQAGLTLGPEATLTFTRAVAALGVEDPDHVYWAGRATLVRRPEDIPAYDQAFAAYFGGRVVRETAIVARIESDGGIAVRAIRWSDREVLRHKDLAACTPAELDQAQRLIAQLRVHPALRRSRRRRPDRHGRGRPDLRRSLRRAVRTDGEVLRLATTRPAAKPRRLVLLLDVSGSMEPYSRALARFSQAAVAARRHGEVEVFALGTRVTRITRELATHDPDRALAQAATAVEDWSGGTRLGAGLRAFNDRWSVARGAIVVVLSDGWDRGDPAVLGAEMARLHRAAHQVVWVNPLKALPGYAPLARGMAAALPHVDRFVEGHSVASLEDLAQLVGASST